MLHPQMHPHPGSRLVHYTGDRLAFYLSHPDAQESGWKAFLRTNLTRAQKAMEETIALAGLRSAEDDTFAGASWRDIPLHPNQKGWSLDLALTEVGYFRAKAYCVDPSGHQHWPHGEDLGISVHPDSLRTGNTIYCAFPRMFGQSKASLSTRNPNLEEQLRHLDERGYTVIPPSGKLRELTACIPHIMDDLGCRILHLLPLGPTPTTYARMGRFGSPYAQMDMEGIDPALVDFDKRSTAEDQFRELSYATHLKNGLVFLDIVINHTGWGSRMMQDHPEWFHRNPDGTFHSPGAWGVTWGDLVELDNRYPELWEVTGKALATWCKRGVDGFRCDAGYMVPLPAWQYLIARIRQEFPDTVFLLEGLGGAWEATELLLTEGGMQWAYSELFQNFTPLEVSHYLDHTLRQSHRMGPLIHYSETHDNDRLAKRGETWSLLRNRLSALTSISGGFAFTAGVEWLATEKIEVHQARGLSWDQEPNMVPELARLNRLLKDHPCFFDGAQVKRLSGAESPVLVLGRSSQEGKDHCWVLINLDLEKGQDLIFPLEIWKQYESPDKDLLDQEMPAIIREPESVRFHLEAGASYCLSHHLTPVGLHGEMYRARRAQADWAYQQLSKVIEIEDLGHAPWQKLADRVAKSPYAFLAGLPHLKTEDTRNRLLESLDKAMSLDGYRAIVRYHAQDLGRVVCVPPDHWMLIEDYAPFAVCIERKDQIPLRLKGIPTDQGYVAAIPPESLNVEGPGSEDAEIQLDRYTEAGRCNHGHLRLLSRNPQFIPGKPEGLALLTNGRGGMARIQADLGSVESKYDCLLGVNLHPDTPCDRHILIKRMRAWVNAEGFLTSLDRRSLVRFEPGPPAKWIFVANAGDGRTVEIHLQITLLQGRNTLLATFTRPDVSHHKAYRGQHLHGAAQVTISLRLDLEDRNFHFETQLNSDAEHYFLASTKELEESKGFIFAPGQDRTLTVKAEGRYHASPEWLRGIWHSLEGTRGLTDHGDAYSPGWFELPLAEKQSANLLASADPIRLPSEEILRALEKPCPHKDKLERLKLRCQDESLIPQAFNAATQFLARRGEGSTVIAGYPWFLDWGRDTLIACRGLLVAGFHEEVRNILLTFARFEDRGTLPNMLSADSTANRDTSDAPLWFGLACEEAAIHLGKDILDVKSGTRTLREVLISIGMGYMNGTPNGIYMDKPSGLIWSPSHFTWMDTNYPAGTPREGYPIEIQALWIRFLHHLSTLDHNRTWPTLAEKATLSMERFWCDSLHCCHDTLLAPKGRPALEALPDGHVRPNQLLAVSLGVIKGQKARQIVDACTRHLLVPGALRSLAPLPVKEQLPIRSASGQLLNDPRHPYQGRYEGDEDTQRKPAYHNGTAWCWFLGVYCEALAKAYENEPGESDAIRAALAYLGSCDRLMHEGCVGHLPEILDGDAPHQQRGCDAQAWSVTEVLRAYLMITGT